MTAHTATAPNVQAAAEPTLAEIGHQLDVLDQKARAYVFAYLAHCFTGAPQPRSPTGMHPKIAAALREIALDEAAAVGIYGRSRARRTAVA